MINMEITSYQRFHLPDDSVGSDSWPDDLSSSIDDQWQLASMVESTGVSSNTWNRSWLGDELCGFDACVDAVDFEFIQLTEESVA